MSSQGDYSRKSGFKIKRRKTFKKKQKNVPLSVKQYVRNYVTARDRREVEMKYHDTQPADVGISNAGTFIDMLDANSQGVSDFQQRVGDMILVKSFRFAAQFTAADSTNVLRLIIFIWHDDTTFNAPTAVQLISSITGSLGVTAPWTFDSVREHKFTILYDKRYQVDADDPAIPIEITHKFKKPNKIGFINATDEGSSKLYAFLISDSQAVPHPNLSVIWTRVVYTDQ